MVKLNETYGTLENISDFKAQVYTSEEVDEGIILYPRHRLAFNQELWVAKMSGEAGTVVLAVLPFIASGSSSGGIISGGGSSDTTINETTTAVTVNNNGSTATVTTTPTSTGADVAVSSDCACCPSVVVPSTATGADQL